MSKRTKKRFIAGAACPSCQKLDSIVLFLENGIETIECVDCGYKQAQQSGEMSGATRQFEQMIGVFDPDGKD